MTGGGITERNLQRILEGSGAEEFHCSARSSRDSAMKFRSVLKPALNNAYLDMFLLHLTKQLLKTSKRKNLVKFF